MILVAGLTIAGLAGIAAAFYFSMRPGSSRAREFRGSGDRGHAPAADRRPPAARSRTSRPSSRGSGRPADAARSAGSAAGARSANGRAVDRAGSSTVIDFTGPQRVLEDPEPEPLVTGRARHGAEPDDADATAKSRRRVGWRKGSDVDEELWPVEAFGGVSDEQFWDDLAADKPLATTARTAPPDSAARRRPNVGPLPDLRPADDRSRGDGRRGAAEGPGTHPQSRLGPDDRAAMQLVQAGPHPSAPAPAGTQPYPAATRPSPVATQPARAAQQPAESRGRSRARIGADEDPLTSPAYCLRPRGSVDGRGYASSRRSGDRTREQYRSVTGQETQAFSLADVQAAAGGYPDGVPPFRQFDQASYGSSGGSSASDGSATNGRSRPDPLRPDPLRADPLRSDPLRVGDGHGGAVPHAGHPYPQQPYGERAQPMNTPPYGERYGYGAPGGDPRRANGGWSPGQPAGNGAGDGSWGSRPAYPPVNGYRGAHEPRGYDRRLRSLPRSRAHCLYARG
jgi:hypothetical protein